jgi:hypothetical protein
MELLIYEMTRAQWYAGGVEEGAPRFGTEAEAVQFTEETAGGIFHIIEALIALGYRPTIEQLR